MKGRARVAKSPVGAAKTPYRIQAITVCCVRATLSPFNN